MALSSKIHVFQVSKSTGGVGAYTRRLVGSLNKDRFQVTVACLSKDSEKMASDLARLDGVNAFSIPMAQHHIDPFSDLKVLYKIYKKIRTEKFDLIHAHTSKPGFLARLAAIGSGVPVIYRPANFSFYDGVPGWQVFIYVALERFAARYLTRRIMMVSAGERELARRYKVGNDAQFVLIRTGIDIDSFNSTVDKKRIRDACSIPEHALVVGTVARLTKDKSPFDFAEAAMKIHLRYPDVHFVWVGDGPLETQLRKKIDELGLKNVFHLTGYQSNVKDFLRIMDCFVLSSMSEALSIAMLEAMASGLPVISTRVNGADEAIVDGETGILIPIGDVEGLVGAMETLLNSPSLLRVMGDAARRKALEEFSLSRMTSEIEALYEEVFMENNKL